MSFGRLRSRPAARPMSEINMTPLIDVMLVLLVIFIISAPLLARSLKLDLPAADAPASAPAPAVLALAIDAQGQVFIGDEALPAGEVRERVATAAAAAARRDPGTEVQLRADAGVPYGRVAELLGWVQAAGLQRIGLVTRSEQEPPAPAAPAPALPAAGG